MNNNWKVKGEEIFFDLYKLMALDVQNLQPDKGEDTTASTDVTASSFSEDQERWLLPEVFLTSLVTTIIVSFLNGFFGKLGQDLLEKLKEIFAGDKKLKNCDSEDLLDYLSKRLPELTRDSKKLIQAENSIYQELIKLKFSENDSKRIASSTIKIFIQKIGTVD